MKKIILLAVVAAVAASCSNKNACTISGAADNVEGYVYLMDVYERSVLDSVQPAGGKFKFNVDAETNRILAVRGTLKAEQEGDNNVFFNIVMVEPGNIVVDVNDASATTGTPANEAYGRMVKSRNALMEQYNASQDAEEREALSNRIDAVAAETFAENSDNIFGALLLEELSYEMTGAAIVEAVDAFPEAVRNSPTLVAMREQGEAKKVTDPGQPYIEVAQPDMDGKEVTLSSVIGNPDNKYVLVDFWASWCGPCMMEVPYLLEAYAQYHGKGFEIYGISHDTNGDRWRNCVKDRGMNWIHVSELNRFDNQAARDYKVRAIPSNFLVDCSTGKIVATNLRGKAVGEKLAELLD